MFRSPIGRCQTGNCLRVRTPRRMRLVPTGLWIAVLLALASVESVTAGRNREHGQRGHGNGNGDMGGMLGGGSFRSRQDRLRYNQPEKFPLTIAKEEQHSEFMKGKSE